MTKREVTFLIEMFDDSVSYLREKEEKQKTKIEYNSQIRRKNNLKKHLPDRHMKNCSSLVIIREMDIKTIMRYHLTLIRMVIFKNYK